MRLLEELGIKLMVDVQDGAMAELAHLRKTGLRPLKPRAKRAPVKDVTK